MNWHQRTAVSLALLLAASLGFSVDYGKLQQAMEGAKSPSQVQRVLKDFKVQEAGDPAIASKAGAVVNVPVPDRESIEEIRDEVRVRALASGVVTPGSVDVPSIQRQKQSPLYNDPGAQAESNWLQKSLESLGEWLRNLFNRPPSRQQSSPSVGGIPEFVTTIVWIIIGAVALACIGLVVNMVVTNSKRVKTSRAMVSDEEAKMTLDEWLAKADLLIANQEYREAVRCLYVACLLRLDRANILEFRRFETNWEHYYRFRDSSRSIPFDFLTPTREFDLIWYGNRTKGLEDAQRFKGFYNELIKVLAGTSKAA